MTAVTGVQNTGVPDVRSEAHLTMFSPSVMVAGQSMYLLTTIAIYLFYRSVVPPEDMRIWLSIAIMGLSFSVLFCLAFVLRKPKPSELLKFWRRIDKRLTHVFDLIAVSAIFLLFPHGDETHRLVALAYCVGYCPSQLIADPENLWANRISIAAILGAFSVQLFRIEHDAALILTILFLLYGGLLIFAAGIFHHAFTVSVEQKIASQNAKDEVTVALSEVSASRDAKTNFIANVSHDLGQPLQAASLILHNMAASGQNTQNAKAISALQNAISTSQSMIGHMLQYLRLEADAVQPQLAEVALEELIAKLVAQSTLQAEKSSVRLRSVPSNRNCQTDASLLSRAIGNLINNSLQHSAGSKLLVGVKSAGKNRLRIWVIDNGLGVPESEQQMVFEDFSQGSKPGSGGFGLGLASVKRIATLLGGAAGIDPRWKSGCAAYIELATT